MIEFEGGYTNDPYDKGGETKYGIAKTYYPNEDIKNLTMERAKQIYFKDYWTKNKCESISPRLRFLFFDSCVIPGPSWSARTLKAFGGDSSKIDPQKWTNARWAYFQSRIVKDSTQKKFEAGWKKRCEKSLKYQNSLNV